MINDLINNSYPFHGIFDLFMVYLTLCLSYIYDYFVTPYKELMFYIIFVIQNIFGK